MKKDEILALYDDGYAESYEDDFLRTTLTRLDTEHELELLRGFLSPGVTWLDVACGTGYFLRHFPEVERAGLDLSPAMLRRARAGNPEVPLLEQDFRDPVPEWVDRWGLVSCMWYAYGLVDTIADVRRVIANLAAWTAPGGTCFVPLADPRLLAGVDLPYLAPSLFTGRVVVTGIQWSFVQEGGRNVHAHMLAPNLEFMVDEFGAFFEDVAIVRYPPALSGWEGRPALVATSKRPAGGVRPTGPDGVPRHRAPGRSSTDPPLLFLHVPRTAGTSATKMIAQRFPAGETRSVLEGVFEGDPDDHAFLAGHLDASFPTRYRTPPVTFTLLREPLARALSMWNFARRETYERYRTTGMRGTPAADVMWRFASTAQDHSLEEVLLRVPAAARPFLGSMQTAYLMGQDFAMHVQVPTTREDLDRAKAHLEQIDVIGLVEDFDASMDWLARRMGWCGFGAGWVENVSGLQSTLAELDPAAVEILTEWNQLDLELYEYAGQLAAERRPAEPEQPAAVLPEASRYHFDQAIHGSGWHEREQDGRGWFCWTGHEAESVLALRAPASRGDHRLRVEVPHVIDAEAVSGLRIRVNDQPIEVGVEHTADGAVVKGTVPGAVIAARDDRLWLSIIPGVRQRPRDLDPTSPDGRLLGIAVREIDVTA